MNGKQQPNRVAAFHQ